MISKIVKKELIMILPYAVFFNAIVYVISVFFIGLNYSMALGLLTGSVVLYINLILLGISTENSINRYRLNRNIKNSKMYMFGNYIIRYIVVGIAIYVSYSVNSGVLINTVGVVIPLIYPKLVYIIKSIRCRKGDEK